MHWRRCPLAWLYGSFLLALGALGIVEHFWHPATFLNPFSIAVFFTVVQLVAIEVHRTISAHACPYAEQGCLFRAVLYIASLLTFVGLSVAIQLRNAGSTIVFLVVAFAVAVGLALHVRVDHADDEFGAAPIWLLLLNWATVVLIVAGPVLIFLSLS